MIYEDFSILFINQYDFSATHGWLLLGNPHMGINSSLQEQRYNWPVPPVTMYRPLPAVFQSIRKELQMEADDYDDRIFTQ